MKLNNSIKLKYYSSIFWDNQVDATIFFPKKIKLMCTCLITIHEPI
jgi:hypothetical protein